MSEIKVTVICMVYNHEAYIKDALEGFVNQITDFPYQVIVHDDASTDNSQEIIKKYAEMYPEIIIPVLQKENQYKAVGPGNVRRIHVTPLIKGKYVAYCEGDDYWCDMYKLQKQVDYLDKHPEYCACVHNSHFLDMRDKSISLFNNVFKNDCDVRITDVIRGVMGIYHTSSLMQRRYLDDITPEYIRAIPGVGDYPRAIYCTMSGKVRYLKDVMSVYRYASNPTSWTYKDLQSKWNAEKIIGGYDKQIKMLSMVAETHPEIKELVQRVIKEKEYLKYDNTGRVDLIKADNECYKIYKEKSLKYKLKLYMKAVIYWWIKKGKGKR